VAIRGFKNQPNEGPLPPFAPLDPPVDLGLIDGVVADPPASVAGAATTPASERYSAWADRMRDKRVRDQARIRGAAGDQAERSNWNADTVIGRAGEHEVRPDSTPLARAEMTLRLGVLGLEPGATPDDIALAYRQLAKVHHPDRWAEADEATQRHHSEEMLRVNAAYRVLRATPIS
jgi:DnaJ-domain-containing protein 1